MNREHLKSLPKLPALTSCNDAPDEKGYDDNSNRIEMPQISLTVHEPHIEKLKGLLNIENQIMELCSVPDLAHFRVDVVIYLLNVIRDSYPLLDMFTLRQHRLVLQILSFLSIQSLKIKDTDPLFKKFEDLRTFAKRRFIYYRNQQGFKYDLELWECVLRYRPVLRKIPRKLCYLAANDSEMMILKPTVVLTPEQQAAYDSCCKMTNAYEFNRLTNIKRIVSDELRFYCLRMESVEAELDIVDIHIERIFWEFVPVQAAWTCTLLKRLRMRAEESLDAVLFKEVPIYLNSTNMSLVYHFVNRFPNPGPSPHFSILDKQPQPLNLNETYTVFEPPKLSIIQSTRQLGSVLDAEEAEPVEEYFPSFSPEQSEQLEHFMQPNPSAEGLITKFNITITRQDVQTLESHNWLNDNVINFYMNLLTERSTIRENNPNVFAFSTFFLTRLSSSGYAGVRRWTRKVDIFAFDIIPVPVHVDGVHFCMAIIDFQNKTIRYYDSMLSDNPKLAKTWFEW